MTPEEFEALQARATRPRRTVPIVLDGDLRQKIEETLAARDAATEAGQKDRRLGFKSQIMEIEEELDRLYAEAEKVTLNVVVEGLAGTPWDAFKANHPSRDGNRADLLWGLNTESSREPLIRETAIGYRNGEGVEPWAEGKLDWLMGFISEGQRENLQIAALAMCRGDDAVPLRRPPSTTETSAEE